MKKPRRSFRENVIELAFSLLDDDYGISTKSVDFLHKVLTDLDATCVLRAMKSNHGRFYIPSSEE